MAAATVGNRYTAALGPIKIELVYLSAVATTNTFTTNLQRPFPTAIVCTDNAGGATVAPKATISGKTVTITQAALTGGTAVVLVMGF